jgi:OFA family oxalate/formate antiporter-like MFS transporter
LHIYYGIGGVGVGVLNGISTTLAIKWFPDRRGFATGIVECGFGAGTALFNSILNLSLSLHGFRSTFFYLGIMMWVVTVPSSLFYRYPSTNSLSTLLLKRKDSFRSATEFSPFRMLRTHQWYLIYSCFALIVSVLLMFAAQMKMLATEFNVPEAYFSFLLVIFPLGNGLSRILAGALSDRIGREKTMSLFYTMLGCAMICLGLFGNIPISFVGIVFFAALLCGSPFVLYSATVGDYFGPKFATTNWGITITSKAWAGLISGWLSGFVVLHVGSYSALLYPLGISCLLVGVISSPRFLKPPAIQMM